MIKIISVYCDTKNGKYVEPIEIETNFKSKEEAENYIKDNNLNIKDNFVFIDEVEDDFLN